MRLATVGVLSPCDGSGHVHVHVCVSRDKEGLAQQQSALDLNESGQINNAASETHRQRASSSKPEVIYQGKLCRQVCVVKLLKTAENSSMLHATSTMYKRCINRINTSCGCSEPFQPSWKHWQFQHVGKNARFHCISLLDMCYV